MAVRAARRLPGIRFEAPALPLDEILPRMDIAAFVGFAASGPVHLPVAVESIAAFEAVFGGRAPLAWDPRRGETVCAQLAPAVRAFFRGGGRRCWVVRVADAPTFNFFPLAGLARISGGTMTPAFARSRAAGSWSDALRVAPAVVPSPMTATAVRHHDGVAVIDLALVAIDDVATGDLLRVEWESGAIAFVAAERLTPFLDSPPSPRAHVSVEGPVWWFQQTLPVAPPASSRVVVYTAPVHPSDRTESFAGTLVHDWTLSGGSGSFTLDLQMSLEDAPAPGALVSIDTGTAQLWLAVTDIGILEQQAVGLDRLQVTGRGLWWMRASPAEPLGGLRRCERLSLELWVRANREDAARLPDLGLVPSHARYWADLRDDNERYAPPENRIVARKPLWDEPPWPLAGAGPGDATYIPIDVALAPERWLGAARQPRTPLERDGVSQFAPGLFLDRDLIQANAETVISTADHVRYTIGLRTHLDGIHAVIGIDEATIIAAPDAAQPGWRPAPIESPPAPHASPPLPQPDWGAFNDCRTRVIDAPQWIAPISSPPLARIDSGTFTLEWDGPTDAAFVVEESHAQDWSDAAAIFSGTATSMTLYGRPRGVYYFRVRAVAGDLTSDWSAGLTIVVSGLDQWITLDASEYSSDTMLAVHRGLMRMAAARGDYLALLSVPAHFRPADAIAHVRMLKGAVESRTFSYTALYYPWAFVRERPGATDLARETPDGLAAGLMARRALTRGAWIAPANDPLPNVAALTPAIGRDEQVALLDAHINAIVQEPRGCVPISASTLSDDELLEPINVRRLLILLRRLALREGATYVFEPNDDAFRRGVQRGFEGWLTRMFERGAFAGRVASSAFRVTTDVTVNTPQSIDAGRFIVEIRVAPSRPMTFLTVRLVQTSDRATVSEVV
jgi:hypothetical protein